MQSTECLQINSKNSILHHPAQQVIVKASLLRSHCSKQCASPIGSFHRLYAWRNTCHAQNTSRQQNRQRECRYKCRYKRSRATVLAFIAGNPRTTAAQAAEALSLSKRQTERLFASLRDKGIISRQGSNKSGNWIINNK